MMTCAKAILAKPDAVYAGNAVRRRSCRSCRRGARRARRSAPTRSLTERSFAERAALGFVLGFVFVSGLVLAARGFCR